MRKKNQMITRIYWSKLDYTTFRGIFSAQIIKYKTDIDKKRFCVMSPIQSTSV